MSSDYISLGPDGEELARAPTLAELYRLPGAMSGVWEGPEFAIPDTLAPLVEKRTRARTVALRLQQESRDAMNAVQDMTPRELETALLSEARGEARPDVIQALVDRIRGNPRGSP